ncbi:hypothetical protein J3F83DRAFT_724172 [Trichoderma novae-zelandiae]
MPTSSPSTPVPSQFTLLSSLCFLALSSPFVAFSSLTPSPTAKREEQEEQPPRGSLIAQRARGGQIKRSDWPIPPHPPPRVPTCLCTLYPGNGAQ